MKDLYLEIRQLIVYQIINIFDCISVRLYLFLLLKMNCAKKHQRHTINYTKKYYKTRIEPVGKPYREVCLCSGLWPVMAYQPNSWSKHPGTRIEQVLAYCRDEQKYVGCIELFFCLTVTMTFGVRT